MRDERRAIRWWEHTQRVVEGAHVVDLVEVLRLPQGGDEPVAGGDPLVDRADDRLQVADLVAPAGRVQPVLAHELLGTHRQAGTWRGALHDEGRHPLDHLGPGEVGQGRHAGPWGRNSAPPRRTARRRTAARPPRPGRGSAPSRCRARRAASCRRTAAAPPGRAAGTSPGCGPSRTSTSWPSRSRTSSTTAAATWWNDSSIRPRTIGPGADGCVTKVSSRRWRQVHAAAQRP